MHASLLPPWPRIFEFGLRVRLGGAAAAAAEAAVGAAAAAEYAVGVAVAGWEGLES